MFCKGRLLELGNFFSLVSAQLPVSSLFSALQTEPPPISPPVWSLVAFGGAPCTEASIGESASVVFYAYADFRFFSLLSVFRTPARKGRWL